MKTSAPKVSRLRRRLTVEGSAWPRLIGRLALTTRRLPLSCAGPLAEELEAACEEEYRRQEWPTLPKVRADRYHPAFNPKIKLAGEAHALLCLAWGALGIDGIGIRSTGPRAYRRSTYFGRCAVRALLTLAAVVEKERPRA